MTAPAQPPPSREHISTYVSIATIYGVTVGVMYLWGYWLPFNINILEYLSLTDLVKSTALPLLSSFVVMVIGIAINELIRIVFNVSFEPGAGRDTPEGRFFNRHARWFTLGYVGLAALIYVVDRTNFKWYTLSAFFAGPLYFAASRRQFLQGLFPNHGPRSAVLYALAVMPFFAFAEGRVQSGYVLSGQKFDYVVSTVGAVETAADAVPTARLRFIGHAGDFLFLLEPGSSQIVISRIESGKPLVLQHYVAKSARVQP